MNSQSRISLLVISLLTALAVMCGQAQETTPSTKVPKLTGLSVADAKAATVKAGFVPKFELGETSRLADQALTVYAQSPKAGTELVRGETVTLTIYAKGAGAAKPTEGASGSRAVGTQPDGKVKVPALMGQTSKVVSTALRGMGLVPKFQLGSDPPTDEKQLTVYEQEPKPGVTVARGSEVRVTIHARRGGEPSVATKSTDGARAAKRRLLELTQVSATPFLDRSNEQIEPRTGEMQLTATDLVVPAGPINLEVQRAFQSLSRKPGLLGTRWQLNWESRLVKNGKWATIEQASRVVIFSPDARSKLYRTPAGDSLMLGKDASVWTKPDGSREVFDPKGRLVEQDRRNGNKVTLQYDTLGRLARVEGPFQAFLNFVTDAEGRLNRIESSPGATVRYDYEPQTSEKPQARDESTVGYGYDTAGMLARIDHPRFGQTQYSYDKKLRVSGHRWADGTSDRIEHDDAARTRRHTDAAGAVSTMQWSADGRRVEVTNPLGHKIVTENDAAGRPIVITGPTGMKARFEYDSLGRTVRVENPAIGVTEFEYAGDGKSPVKLIAPDGNEQSFEYDEQFNLVRQTNSQHKSLDTAFKFDAKGQIQNIEMGDGQRSTFTYDEAGRRNSVTNADGQKWRFEFDERGNLLRTHDPLGGVTERTYDMQDRLTSVTNPEGAVSRIEYAQQGRNFQTTITSPRGAVTRNVYNQRGQLVTTTAPGNRTTRFNYDASGNLTSRTDPAGRTFQFERDAVGNLLREINPAGGVTARTYNAQGNVVSTIGPTGATTRREYSPTGFLSRQVDSTGLPTEYQYDAQGHLLATINDAQQATQYDYANGRVAKVSPPSGRAVELKYDDRGFLVSTQRGEKDVVTNEYDVLGRRAKETRSSGLEISFRYDALGRLIASEDNQGGRETTEYDRAGRMVATQDANGATIKLKYDADGNLLETTDPLGRVKRRVYNAAGELSEVIEPNGDKAKYEYDAVGRLTTAHHPSGGKSSYAYDPLGLPTRIRNPLGKETRSIYDIAGRLTSVTDAIGQTTTFAYDVAGRMTEKRLADGKVVKYQYDARGRLSEVDDGAFPIQYTRNLDGRVTRIEYPAIKRSLSYEYNEAGAKTKLVDSEGRTIHYEYDNLDRLSAVRVGDSEPIRFAYDAKGRLTARVYPNGIRGTWQYDGDDRLLKLTYTDAAGKTLAGWTYQYDAAGNRVQTTDAEGRSVRHRYDPAGQLLEEVIGDKEAVKYSYLAGGNRGALEQNGKASTYRYNEADQLLAAGDETFTHDPNGNLVERKGTKGTTRYDWDSENRLVKVVLPDGKEVTYGYAPTGERIWRRDEQGLTHFVTDGQNLLAELSENLEAKTHFLHGPGIDQPLVMSRGEKNYFFHAEKLGSISHITDERGAVAAAYQYDAFGEAKRTQGQFASPFTYTARELDSATGLYYYRARYYDARLGRFLSTDAAPARIALPATWNLYAYVQNRPTQLVDPSGAEGEEPYWGPRWEGKPLGDKLRTIRDIVKADTAEYENAKRNYEANKGDSSQANANLNRRNYRDNCQDALEATKAEQARLRAELRGEARAINGEKPVGSPSSNSQPKTGVVERPPIEGGAAPPRVQTGVVPRAEPVTPVEPAVPAEPVAPPEPVLKGQSTFADPAAVPGSAPPIRSQVMGGVAAGGVVLVGFDAMASGINGESAGDIAVETVKGTATGLVVAGGVGLMTGAVGAVGGYVVGGPPGALAGFAGGFKAGFGATAIVGTAVGTVKTGKKLGEIAGQLGEGAADAPSAELGERAGGRIEIPPEPKDDWAQALGPLLTPDELADATSAVPSGDLTDEDRARAKDASIQGRARDADRTLTAREREAAAQQAAGAGQGLPGGGGYNEPNYEEIGRGIGELINLLGNGSGGGGGGTPHRGGQMGNHPK